MRATSIVVLGLILSSALAGKEAERDGALSFVVLGDWGGQGSWPYYTNAERSVASQMGKTATQIGSRFTVSLGDNFYMSGVKDVEDARFTETFENIFTASSLQSRWYVICGNHDHLGNASAQVAYTSHSKRWFMPDLYYNEVMTIPGTSSTVEFVFIDTVTLSGLTDPQLRSLPPSGPKSPALADEQWTWIEDTLSKSKADWIIVAGHYPVWSIAEHGPTQLLVERLRPLLTKYNVSAYFCGHDHNLQHIQENGSSVNYFVNGAAHHLDTSQQHKMDIPAGSLKFEYSKPDSYFEYGGYASVSIDTRTMNVTFYDTGGNKLYSVMRPKIRLL